MHCRATGANRSCDEISNVPSMCARQKRTSHGVRAVKCELHVVLCGDAEYAPNVVYERLVAARPAAHRHVVHLRAQGPG